MSSGTRMTWLQPRRVIPALAIAVMVILAGWLIGGHILAQQDGTRIASYRPLADGHEPPAAGSAARGGMHPPSAARRTWTPGAAPTPQHSDPQATALAGVIVSAVALPVLAVCLPQHYDATVTLCSADDHTIRVREASRARLTVDTRTTSGRRQLRIDIEQQQPDGTLASVVTWTERLRADENAVYWNLHDVMPVAANGMIAAGHYEITLGLGADAGPSYPLTIVR